MTGGCREASLAPAVGETHWEALKCTCRALGLFLGLGPVSPVVHKHLSLFGQL